VAAPTVRPRTLEAYTWLVRKHIGPTIGSVRLARLTPQRVQGFYAERLKSGLSPTTVNHIHSVLHRGLEQAVIWGLVPRNVTDLTGAPQFKRRAPSKLCYQVLAGRSVLPIGTLPGQVGAGHDGGGPAD
jgi:hypothetical protein